MTVAQCAVVKQCRVGHMQWPGWYMVCDLWFVYMVARPECVVSLPGYQTFSKGGKEREREREGGEGGMRENVFKL